MGKQDVVLEIRGEENVNIQPYLPKKYCPAPGYLIGENLPEDCIALIGIEHCEGCFTERIKPSPTGYAYYETYLRGSGNINKVKQTF